MTTSLLVPAGDRLRANNFDAIRLTMALLVVWSHSFALWRGSEDSEPLSVLTGGLYNSGNVGVLAFFAISGFLITLSFRRSANAWQFLKRRIARIHPGYLVAITLCSLVIVPAFSTRRFGVVEPDEAAGLVSNLFLRNYIVRSDAFGTGVVDGSLWSIPYEFWCYLGVMALGLAGLLRRRAIVPILAVAVMLTRVWLDWTGRKPGGGWIGEVIGFPYFWFNVLPPFLLGSAIYLYRERIPRSGLLALTMIAGTLVLMHLPVIEPVRITLARLAAPPTLAYVLFYAVFDERIELHGAARYGDFSYGTYLYAFPIQQMLAASLRGAITFPLFILLSMILSLTAGIASWHLVERWFLPRMRSDRAARDRPPLQNEAAIVAP